MKPAAGGSALVVTALLAGACGSSTPRSPSVPPGGEVTITGSERLGWDQPVANAEELERIRFAVYIDASTLRVELPATCQPPDNQVAACSSPLPRLTAGRHTLATVSYYADQGRESNRTAPLTVIVSTSTAAGSTRSENLTPPAAAVSADCAVGVLDDRRTLAAFPTGEMRVMDAINAKQRVLEWQGLGDEWTLRSAAGHPQFATNHLVFALLTRAGPDDVQLAIVRFRELDGVLGERAVIHQESLNLLPQRPRLRFGPDGKLWVLLLDGSDAAARLANGATVPDHPLLLRLDDDGAIPRDNPVGSPCVARTAVPVFAAQWISGRTTPMVIAAQADSAFAVFATSADSTVPLSSSLRLPRGVLPIALHASAESDGRRAPLDLWTTDSDGVPHALSPAGDTPMETVVPAGGATIHDAALRTDRTIAWCGSAAQPEGGDSVYVSALMKPRN